VPEPEQDPDLLELCNLLLSGVGNGPLEAAARALAAPDASPQVGPLSAGVDTGADGTFVPTDVIARLDVPVSVDTWRATVLDEACRVGAVVGNDISGFGDPDYLAVASKHQASVVATHIRLAPRVPDPDPYYDDLVTDVRTFLLDRAARGEAAGLVRDQISIDAGLDLGKTPAMSAVLLRASDELAATGYTLLLSASNKRFLGELLDLEIDDRRDASLAAVAYGVAHGCRIVRVHDVAGSVRVCRTVEAILTARRGEAPGPGIDA
jgi:dihydropteroate synthase